MKLIRTNKYDSVTRRIDGIHHYHGVISLKWWEGLIDDFSSGNCYDEYPGEYYVTFIPLNIIIRLIKKVIKYCKVGDSNVSYSKYL